MVESVTAAIFNSDDAGGQMYAESGMLAPPALVEANAFVEQRLVEETKLDELVNARADDHLNVDTSPEPDSHVKTPPAAVKSMILTAAAEILTSDSTMNALVTSGIMFILLIN